MAWRKDFTEALACVCGVFGIESVPIEVLVSASA